VLFFSKGFTILNTSPAGVVELVDTQDLVL
jgi:hypothetical protein